MLQEKPAAVFARAFGGVFRPLRPRVAPAKSENGRNVIRKEVRK
jgi:hypothetical protein